MDYQIRIANPLAKIHDALRKSVLDFWTVRQYYGE